MIINVITLPSRRSSIIAEIEKHGLTAIYWDGITEDRNPRKNISRSHKRIISFAKNNNLPSILLAEDDCRFFGEQPGEAFKYYLDNRPTENYDLYLGSYYTGQQFDGNRVKNFRGLTLYECMASFYDRFLECSEQTHIDAALSMTQGKFYVCPKFVAYQEKGYSFQRQRFADDSKRLIGKPIYGQ